MMMQPEDWYEVSLLLVAVVMIYGFLEMVGFWHMIF